MGPISTGLGEIYMWIDRLCVATIAPGWQRLALRHAGRRSGSTRTSSAPRICGPCRTGSSGRRSRACRASPASMPSAATSSNTTCNPIPSKLIALGLSFADVARRH